MKLVVFDIDGTLTDTVMVDDMCFKRAFLKTFNIDISNQQWHTLQNVTDWGITEEIIVRAYGRLPLKIEYEIMLNNFLSELLNAQKTDINLFKEISGAYSFVNYLSTQPNIKVGFATGGWSKTALLKLSAININPKGYPFCNSDMYKSRIEILKSAIMQAQNNYEQEFESIVYFGDGIWDLKVCQALNINFIGIDAEQNKTLEKSGAKIVFKDYKHLKSIVSVINNL
jgi:phosphoglycolate phosphatase-like HAD superfamily hydrolase